MTHRESIMECSWTLRMPWLTEKLCHTQTMLHEPLLLKRTHAKSSCAYILPNSLYTLCSWKWLCLDVCKNSVLYHTNAYTFSVCVSCITAVHFYGCTCKVCLWASQRRVLKCHTRVCDAFVQFPIQPKTKCSVDYDKGQQNQWSQHWHLMYRDCP